MIRWYPRSIERVTIVLERPTFKVMTEREITSFPGTLELILRKNDSET